MRTDGRANIKEDFVRRGGFAPKPTGCWRRDGTSDGAGFDGWFLGRPAPPGARCSCCSPAMLRHRPLLFRSRPEAAAHEAGLPSLHLPEVGDRGLLKCPRDRKYSQLKKRNQAAVIIRCRLRLTSISHAWQRTAGEVKRRVGISSMTVRLGTARWSFHQRAHRGQCDLLAVRTGSF